MALTYGFLKERVQSTPQLKSSRRKHETQFHVHTAINADHENGSETWT